MEFFRSNLEKDFEFFVKNITKLEPVEFCGLAKIMGIPTLRGLNEIGLTVEELKKIPEEKYEEIQTALTIPGEEILEKMMDRFLGLSKKRRREINQILKDIQRGK